MNKKRYIYVAIAISIVLLAIFMSYKKYNNYLNSGLYGTPLKQINADGILPYNKQITPKIAIIDTGVHLDNTFLKKEILNKNTQIKRLNHLKKRTVQW